jgi:hypothetical protein
MKNIQEKVLKAIENNKLKLVEGQKSWYNYFISIQELCVVRNNRDWYIIDIYEEQYWKQLVRINI